MVKPVTAFTTFGSNTTGTTTQLDNNFLTLKNAVNDLNTYANFLTDTGAANAYVVTLPANITGSLTNGLPIQVKVTTTNTGASVINYNATGNANIINLDGTTLSANQIKANSIILLQYASAVSSWILQSPNPSSQQPIKAWGYITQSAGTYTLIASLNVANIVKNSNGNVQVNMNANVVSSGNYAVTATLGEINTNLITCGLQSNSNFTVDTRTAGGVSTPAGFSFIVAQ